MQLVLICVFYNYCTVFLITKLMLIVESLESTEKQKARKASEKNKETKGGRE